MMKSRDGVEIVKNHIYYYVSSCAYIHYPEIIKVKCDTIITKSSFLRNHAVFNYHTKLEPFQIRQSIFKSFDKAKDFCIREIKKTKKEIEQKLKQTASLSKKDIDNEK